VILKSGSVGIEKSRLREKGVRKHPCQSPTLKSEKQIFEQIFQNKNSRRKRKQEELKLT